MVKNDRIKVQDAVSPVVGVMLMLIVTIIIAAVVAAFASSTTTTTEKTPHVVISGTYSQAHGLEVQNVGGDSVPTYKVDVRTRLSSDFGDYSHFSWPIDKIHIFNSSSADRFTADSGGIAVQNGSWTYMSSSRRVISTGVGVFAPGDYFYVSPLFMQNSTSVTNLTGGNIAVPSSYTYNYNNAAALGHRFILELSLDGKVFSKTEIPIEP